MPVPSTKSSVDLASRHRSWTETDWQSLTAANSLQDLVQLAFRIMDRMPKPIAWVCGPITNGGVGSIEGNLQVFADTIEKLSQEGAHVFDQLPLGKKLNIFAKYEVGKFGLGEKTRLLEGFYLPIFESGIIGSMYFIPGWESSSGASWEHAQAQRLGLKIVYLS